MTRSIKTLALVTLLSATTASTLFATGNRVNLTQSDWENIETNAIMESGLDLESMPPLEIYLLPEEWNVIESDVEWENSLDFESIPTIETASVVQGNLNLNLNAGRKVAMELNAPFNPTDQVGIAIIDAEGSLVYAKDGEFNDVKSISFSPAFVKDATYIIRIYSATKVYETSLQVLNI
jgi:hypothetical protein